MEKTIFDMMFPSAAAVVTPNDGTDLSTAGIIYVGGSGDVKVDTLAGDTVTFYGVPAGSYVPVRVKRVYSTGTTATNMVVMSSKYA